MLAIHLDAPAGAPNCVSFDFRFLSDEFPENVGLPVNDGFVAELDTQSVTTDDTGDISAPNNFAFDQTVRWSASTPRGPHRWPPRAPRTTARRSC